jgi:hypothetical protein
MEADWSVEIGPDRPLIDASWNGLVDLRLSPIAIDTLPEAAQHPALRNAIWSLNSDDSPVFTTKCDTWALTPKEIDPDEFDATPEDSHVGFASYIDVVERDPAAFVSFALHERCARRLATHLRQTPQRHCRVDIVVRIAATKKNRGYGLTLYAAGCGASESDAYAAWQAVLAASVPATMTAARASSSIG